MLAAGIVVPLVGAFAAAQAALVPIDPWHVEYNASSCVLRRTFGTATDPVIFAVEPSPYDDVVSLMLLKRSVTTSPSKMGPAAVVLSGGLAPPDLSYSSASAAGFRVTTIVVRREVMAGLKGGQSIAIRAGGEADVVLQPTGLDKAMIALDSCESDLLVAWGFDKDAQAAVAVPPKSTLTGVVRADDYPIDALKKGYGGTVGYRLKIETDGRISECRVVRTSGHADLDATTCRVLQKRARYAPAQGHDGKPITSFDFGQMVWAIFG